jgi:hypothetical protein
MMAFSMLPACLVQVLLPDVVVKDFIIGSFSPLFEVATNTMPHTMIHEVIHAVSRRAVKEMSCAHMLIQVKLVVAVFGI